MNRLMSIVLAAAVLQARPGHAMKSLAKQAILRTSRSKTEPIDGRAEPT